MAQTLDTEVQAVKACGQTLSPEARQPCEAKDTGHRLVAFVSELQRMTPEERIRASRYTMDRWEYWAYAARFPDEVPTVNGELERIALTLE